MSYKFHFWLPGLTQLPEDYVDKTLKKNWQLLFFIYRGEIEVT